LGGSLPPNPTTGKELLSRLTLELTAAIYNDIVGSVR
jgi:hypothetical protein